MTKLDQLNVFLSERLAAVVKEILDTVSRTVQEYEEETARKCKENEYLKEMLTLTGWSFTELNPGRVNKTAERCSFFNLSGARGYGAKNNSTANDARGEVRHFAQDLGCCSITLLLK